MNPKFSIEDYLIATDQHQKTTSAIQIKKKANDAFNKITESLFTNYKQSTNNQKRKNHFNNKTNYDSLIGKPFQLKASIVNEDNKNKRNKSKENLFHCHQKSQIEKSIHNNSRNINESQSISHTLNSNYNFISHNKHKSTGLFINNNSYSKDKGRKINMLGIGQDVIRKCSKDKDRDKEWNSKAKDRSDNNNNNMKIKLNQKLTIGNIHKKKIIKNYLLNNYTTPNTNKCINDKQNDKSTKDDLITSTTIQKKNDNHAQHNHNHHHNTNVHKQISRSNSISNLDQTTKTSTEATTTTSKRLYDQMLKSTSNKPSVQNLFNNKMNPNISSFYLAHFSKPTHKKKDNKRNSHLNNSILNQLQTINKTMTTQHQMKLSAQNILNTEEELSTQLANSSNQGSNYTDHYSSATKTNAVMEQIGTHLITEPLFNEIIKSKSKKMKLNDTGSLSLLSEDSVFNYSKHRSTSGNNNNSLACQNDSISFKRSSHKYCSNNNSNTIEKRSSSKDKLSSENYEVDPTVSYTYSDDEITGRKSRKTRRNVQRAFNNEDFLTFYTEMNQKLFGYNPNIK